MIELSLNEVESVAAKAARGMGLDWGLAEDVGRAARRLAAAGLDWTGPVLGLDLDPSPALTGVQLGDQPHDPGEPRAVETANPVLVAALAAASPAARVVTWPGTRLEIGGGRMQAGQGPLHSTGRSVAMLVSPAAREIRFGAAGRRSRVDPAVLEVLQGLVHRTYVPESARSRAQGAGSSLSDND